MRFLRSLGIGFILLFVPLMNASAEDREVESFHMGIFHPSGVDMFGRTTEKKIINNMYRFYTYGFPSFVATGYNYYQVHQGRGMTETIGVGLGTILYASLAYQFQIGAGYLKLGAGYATGLAYNGAYPVISFEQMY